MPAAPVRCVEADRVVFVTLPLFLDLGDLRIVHACWDADEIAVLDGINRLNDELLHKSVTKGSPEHRAIRVMLKGKDIALPDGQTFTTPAGDVASAIHVKWWLGGEDHTYHSLCMPECDTVPKVPVPATATAGLKLGYAATEPPTFVGHYWLLATKPEPLASNVACVDYSVARKGGMLVAYRWDGERRLDPQKFVSVSRESLVEKSFKVLVDDNFDYMDEDARSTLGTFPTLEAARAACKKVVDDFLRNHHKSGMTAEELYDGYTSFGDDPWISTDDGVRHFSGWEYAKHRCDEICGNEGRDAGGPGNGN